MQELLVDIEDQDELYRSYMPFLKSGGIFIKTNTRFDMGAAVSLRIMLPDALEEEEATGKVVWITPQGAQNSNPPGIGVSFDTEFELLNDKIVKLLGTALNHDKPTYTM
ncbi:PilZ domain-containing protein [Pseudoalteromonas luteoviolacea]|uniref:Pilus biosynthesis protein PilZ n=1 Tax=Pseudoalteromonas luteoviolacea DSM 6061 TaxID=1365250 RepID=A0A166V8Z0_9GAMM|nr:PilZ domain-containing protein [Pseudoalteromonas luteoviolacea]KZN32379.1 pilus biosynthesis protein PilZ [Pseudoalteromonas luteoviolacea DSM 6061]KZN56723.1 pilus biosynthesis protein PilZ [Pseudoalteromonas luteoviolacea CPMOR-2]MBE0386109.1 type IV pilus assembly protein PilZ [Pseudoalteromonas luteoviolacea DSM 6061]TQF71018.1 pilus assembly protein PilZ [Pseudoalteromonas luteoviolacea]